MEFNLYIGNHGKRDGIEDFIEIISNILSRRGHMVTVSSELKIDSPNIIIDEFTNFIANKKIAEIKNTHPETKLIYVLTEFIESKYGVKSFNLFGGILDASAVSLINLFLRIRRSDFLPPKLSDFLSALILLPFSLLFFAVYLGKMLLRRRKISLSGYVHSKIYMHMRYLGFESMLRHADLLLLAHEANANGLKQLIKPGQPVGGVLYPEVDKEKLIKNLFSKKSLSIEITGSVTKYRQKWINRINNTIVLLGIKKEFQMCQHISFSNKKNKDEPRGAFSFHPPQNAKWKYSSPTRIFRALTHDFNLPVLTKYFGQNPIEDICLIFDGDDSILQMYDFYHNKQKALAFLTPRISKYSSIAELENNKIAEAMLSLR